MAGKTSDKAKRYFLVNPAGAIHEVSYEHAKARLKQIGYRMATADEVKRFQATKAQNWDSPIARPWSPDPDPEPEPKPSEGD